MPDTAVIVGAGAAGLAALHAMQRAGFEATAFEQHAELGGVWSTTRYPSLAMHARSFSYRFCDFPPMTSRDAHATGAEVRAYFDQFVRANGLAGRISYGHRIDRVVYRPDVRPRCVVTVRELATGATREHACDVVICATGYANAGRPHVPELEGRAASRVRVLHSSEVSQEICDDLARSRRKVVVLGAGRSAHEILSLLRGYPVDVTWVYLKSLWSTSYEKLYSDPLREPWNAALYLYYMAVQHLRRKLGWGPAMQLIQAPLVRSGFLVNPLEPESDVCRNRGAIMKAEQLAFLRTVRSVRAGVVGLGPDTVVLDRTTALGGELGADYLICATGYDRRANLPAVAIDRAGTLVDHSLAAQHGFYLHMVDPEVPAVSLLSAAILYPQHVLGFSLGAHWLARFHRGQLVPQPTTAEMRRWLADRGRELGPWCSDEYLSGGVPYAHQRDKDVLPVLFAQLGLAPELARQLVLTGTRERAFHEVCERIARALSRGPR